MKVAVLFWFDDGERVIESVHLNYGLAMLRREDLMADFDLRSRDFSIEEHEVYE